MKVFFFVFALMLTGLVQAQFQDLEKLANGTLIYNTSIYDDNEKLFGYLYLYEQDVNETSTKIEYVLLDKNLNKVANGSFPAKRYKDVLNEFYDCTLMGDCIILNKLYFYYVNSYEYKILATTFQTIWLKDNIVSSEYQYENSEFKEFSADQKKMKSEYKAIEKRSYVNAFSNESFKGFLITEDDTKKNYLEKEIKFMNDKREMLWKYEYNPEGTDKKYNVFHVLYSHKNTIYISTPTWEKDAYGSKKITNYNIVALDMQTGQKKFEYILENSSSQYSHTLRLNQIDNKLVLVGNYSPYKKTDFSLDDNLGFYKIVLDENGKEIEKKYSKWSEFAGQIQIDERGRAKDNYRLNPMRYFFFKNGSISILTKKIKSSGYKTSDFVLFNMNPDFTPAEVNTITKEKDCVSSTYLFSQYIKDDTGVVFFYRNEVNSKGRNGYIETVHVLAINTIIDGKLSEEKIPLNAKKEYLIYPYPAKEGYIMLREYNKKDKYNQVRLEKLNYWFITQKRLLGAFFGIKIGNIFYFSYI